jgi:hypothetical protein
MLLLYCYSDLKIFTYSLNSNTFSFLHIRCLSNQYKYFNQLQHLFIKVAQLQVQTNQEQDY